MEFESPDVAKEFPGLALPLADTPEYEDGEKSKKKKDKKDSKKDKGYAALAGESSAEEDEVVGGSGDSKSPGKVKIVKAFSLSKKKDKDKDVKKSAEKEKSSDKKEKELKKSAEKSSEKKEKDKDKDKELKKATEKPVEQQRPVETRRPFDGQHRKSMPATMPSSSATMSTSASKSIGQQGQPEKSKGLNVFLNAPLPMLLKKKEKESKKEKDKDSTSAKVKLKLKRGSKSSLEDSCTSVPHVTEAPSTPSHQHLPEEPEVIAKEIRKYEALLEQTHSQFKTGKKMSKKHEDQLWELQRTLTQLKRKLRSVNALSASFTPSSSLSSTQPSSSSNPYVSSSESEKSSKSVVYQAVILPIPTSVSGDNHGQSVVLAPPGCNVSKVVTLPKDESLDFTPQTAVVLPKATEPKQPTSVPENQVESEVAKSEPDEAAVSEHHPLESPEIVETLQVEVEVHTSRHNPNSYPTPEDAFEKEISSFDDGPKASPLEPRQNVDILKGSLLRVDEPKVSKSEPTLGVGDKFDDEISEDDDDGDYVILREDTRPREPAFKVNQAPSIFDPFSLPVFQTDEFLLVENECLIAFNQELQEQIVEEEEAIELLIQELTQGLQLEEPKISSDLTELDDDELVNVWQAAKFENDTLNEQVTNLRTMVATSRLEAFRLETRLKYIQDYMARQQDSVPESLTAGN